MIIRVFFSIKFYSYSLFIINLIQIVLNFFFFFFFIYKYVWNLLLFQHHTVIVRLLHQVHVFMHSLTFEMTKTETLHNVLPPAVS